MKEFNFDGYKLIVKCREKDLVEWLGRQIPKIYGKDNCVVTEKYIFGKGSLPVILCAHMDTVFKSPPEIIVYDRKQELIMSPQGIGGDDRNGIYSILTLINKYKGCLPYVLFTTKEEVGCLGAKDAAKPLTDKVKGVRFAVQLDRQGSNDAVFYQCRNKSFIKYICSFGYKETLGTSTDICYLCPKWNIAGVNFSCGYMYNHSKEELVNVKDMYKTISMVEKILDDVKSKPEQKPFPYCESNKGSVLAKSSPEQAANAESANKICGVVFPKPQSVLAAMEFC